MAANSMKLLTGNSHPVLARKVADRYVLFLLSRSYMTSDGPIQLGPDGGGHRMVEPMWNLS